MKSFSKEEIINKITNIFYVYGLINPLNNKIFYIGKGKKNRLFEHEYNVKVGIKSSNRHLYYTIKKILNNNFEVKYCILFNSDDEKLSYEKEKFYILKYKKQLVNIFEGGRGRSSGRFIDIFGEEKGKEILKKISKNHADVSGEKNPRWIKLPKHISKIEINNNIYYQLKCKLLNKNKNCKKLITIKSKTVALRHKKICHTCSVSDKRNGMYGKKFNKKTNNEIWIEKYGIEEANRRSESSRIKMIKTITGKKHYEETKIKMSNSAKGKKKTKEHCLNISKSKKITVI